MSNVAARAPFRARGARVFFPAPTVSLTQRWRNANERGSVTDPRIRDGDGHHAPVARARAERQGRVEAAPEVLSARASRATRRVDPRLGREHRVAPGARPREGAGL